MLESIVVLVARVFMVGLVLLVLHSLAVVLVYPFL